MIRSLIVHHDIAIVRRSNRFDGRIVSTLIFGHYCRLLLVSIKNINFFVNELRKETPTIKYLHFQNKIIIYGRRKTVNYDTINKLVSAPIYWSLPAGCGGLPINERNQFTVYGIN